MKAVFLVQRSVRRAGSADKESPADRFESVLLKVVTAVFIIMVVSQIVLSDTSMRSTVYSGYFSEGRQLGKEAYLFTPCKMELKLCNLSSCPDLSVLVNGEQRAVFTEKKVLLELKMGDIVELDASSLLTVADVQISSVSKNIGGLLGRTMTVTDGISEVARIAE